MNKKYTVFLSSTYDDLREERNEVVHALLELDCIPCGMEYFPSDDNEQFEFIKSIIDECDYYVLIIAGRYGTIGKNGKSYTEMEYRYALKQKIPIATFIHDKIEKISLDKSEKDPIGREKLEALIKFASKGKLVKYWSGKEDLAGKVSRSMVSLIKRHPAIGWVRGDNAVDSAMIRRMQTVYEENLNYKEKEISSREKEKLKSGAEKVRVVFDVLDKKTKDVTRNEIIEFAWNELFKIVGLVFLEETRKYNALERLNEYVLLNNAIGIEQNEIVELSDESFSRIIIQFIGLDLIEIIHPNHDNDFDMIQESRYRLTKEGETCLVDLLAEKD